MLHSLLEHEQLAIALNHHEARRQYAAKYDGYKIGWIARFLGGILIGSGSILFGHQPSYEKFRAIEIIARIPYQSWEACSYMIQTFFYADEKRAIRLANINTFARVAQDNETMHVILMSQLMRRHQRRAFIRSTVLPLAISFFYLCACYFLYFIRPKAALELNYLFEQHAFHQYDTFLHEHEDALKDAELSSAFLNFYGRNVDTEYDFFCLVRNDELIHRNRSIEKIKHIAYYAVRS